jgi:hypothetical protein
MAGLTAARLRELLHYDAATGVFTRKVAVGRLKAGTTAGWDGKDGYLRITVDQRRYSAHRLVWLYVHGHWPAGEIDHVNGHKQDNRLVNLRDVSRLANSENKRAAHKGSGVGLLGVSAKGVRFHARIVVAGKYIHLGAFDTAAAAHAKYLDAKRRLHAGFVG